MTGKRCPWTKSSPQQRQHDYDFSGLQGLQVVGSAAGAGGDEGPENSLWREALRSELEARAARFRQAVDASIVLANDGVIRWLGDPIAKLATGPDLLSPRAVILADTVCPRQLEKPSRRGSSCGWRRRPGDFLDLCLPCEAWRAIGPVHNLAAKISESLGVLEREPMRSQIKALDQNSRAALRKHGIRFGAFTFTLPPCSNRPRELWRCSCGVSRRRKWMPKGLRRRSSRWRRPDELRWLSIS